MDTHPARRALTRWALGGWLAVGLAAAACGGVADAPGVTPTTEEGAMAFSLRSDAFDADQPIPSRFTCDGDDMSPALSWTDTPPQARSFALIMDDPDAPRGVFTHWVYFDLPATTHALPEAVPKSQRPENGGVQGTNDFDKIGYGGPCPPAGSPHRYRFTLYALDEVLGLEPGASKQQVLTALEGHIVGEAQIVGTYQR